MAVASVTSPDGRIAAHLGYFVHVHRDHHSASTHACSRAGSFTTGVSGADHDDIIMKSRIHNYAKIMILWQISDRHAASHGGMKKPLRVLKVKAPRRGKELLIDEIGHNGRLHRVVREEKGV